MQRTVLPTYTRWIFQPTGTVVHVTAVTQDFYSRYGRGYIARLMSVSYSKHSICFQQRGRLRQISFDTKKVDLVPLSCVPRVRLHPSPFHDLQ